MAERRLGFAHSTVAVKHEGQEAAREANSWTDVLAHPLARFAANVAVNDQDARTLPG